MSLSLCLIMLVIVVIIMLLCAITAFILLSLFLTICTPFLPF